MKWLITWFVFTTFFGFSQETLKITFNRLGKQKLYELFSGDIMEFRKKGNLSFKTKKILALRDSGVFFTDETYLNFKNISIIKLRKNNPLINVFQGAFKTAGIAFFILDTGNNLILDKPQLIHPKAALVSASLFVTGMFIHRLGIVKIRLNKRKSLKVLPLNYQFH